MPSCFLPLKCLAVAFFIGLVAYPAVASESNKGGQTKRPPNIVLVVGDDMHWEDCGAYGSKMVKTPNIDRLATQGMTFDRSFTATAMCAPTRQQLYTGIFPVRNGAYPNHSRVHPHIKSVVQYFRPLGYRVGLYGKSHVGPPTVFSWEKAKDVKEFINRDADQPYFLVYASHSPHAPWSAGDASQYPVDKIKVPPYLVDTPVIREALANYYAEITDLDREVGECMKLVEESGTADNTIFIFTTEQGSAFPFGGKWTCYDNGLKTGLVIRWPDQVKAGSRADAMVQYVDVVPTLMQAAGAEAPKDIDGRSFLGVLQGDTDKHNDYVYGVHTTRGIINGNSCYPIRSVRSEKYKLIENLNHTEPFTNALTPEINYRLKPLLASWHGAGPEGVARAHAYQHRPAVEFYDIVADPYELKNLAADPQYADEIATLRTKLHAWMKQQGDEGVATEEKHINPRHKKKKSPKKDKSKK